VGAVLGQHGLYAVDVQREDGLELLLRFCWLRLHARANGGEPRAIRLRCLQGTMRAQPASLDLATRVMVWPYPSLLPDNR
jgi:hypothetical protein